MQKLEIAAVILVLLGIFGLPAAAIGYESIRHSGFDGQVITLSGAHAAWSRDTIHVRQGESVRLRLTSNDVVHGFMIKAYGIEIDEVYPGKVTEIDFVADKPGTFAFVCTIICSGQHRDMEGQLVVEPAGAQSVSALSGQN